MELAMSSRECSTVEEADAQPQLQACIRELIDASYIVF